MLMIKIKFENDQEIFVEEISIKMEKDQEAEKII